MAVMQKLGKLKGALSGGSKPTLQRATLVAIDQLTGDILGMLECQFNPQELTVTKGVSWYAERSQGMNAPELYCSGGRPARFSLNLIFDTTRETDPAEQDVRKYTNVLLSLTLLGEDTNWGRVPPPLVLFVWGDLRLFTAVVEQVSVSYTLFLPSGKPVRARAQVNFVQLDLEDDELPPTNPTTRTEARRTHVVQEGERLDLIAYQEYGHPSYWRHLAEVNGLEDPLDLRPGQVLLVPRL